METSETLQERVAEEVRAMMAAGVWLIAPRYLTIRKPLSPRKKEQPVMTQYVIVRTRDAGVFAGTLHAPVTEITAPMPDGLILTDARRIWYWDGAASLSQLAVEGTSKPRQCKFPAPVPKVALNGVIEVLAVTAKARESIEAVPEWSA